MKKTILILVILLSSITANAQWKIRYYTDDYTEEKSTTLEYDFKSPILGCVSYFQVNALWVFAYHHETENFDVFWNAGMNNNGYIKYYDDVFIKFFGKSPIEYKIHTSIENSKNTLCLSFIINDADKEILNNMKQNNRMKIKYYDIVTEQYEVITISLHGFTSKCNKMDL